MKFLVLALLLLCPTLALAQSTATPVVPGYLTTSGCPAGQTACFVQNGPPGGSGPGGSTNIAIAPVDASGTITTGGTFQALFASNLQRTNCFVQNPTTATEPLYVHWDTTIATLGNSGSLAPGASFSCAGGNTIIVAAITVTAATTAHAFVATGQ